MPRRKKIDEENHITSIHVLSKRTINLKATGEYYSFECGLEADTSNMTSDERDEYKDMLWEKANAEVDSQAQQVYDSYVNNH